MYTGAKLSAWPKGREIMSRGKTALAYAAGIVDGEGCISIHKKSRLTEPGRSTCPVNITLTPASS